MTQCSATSALGERGPAPKPQASTDPGSQPVFVRLGLSHGDCRPQHHTEQSCYPRATLEYGALLFYLVAHPTVLLSSTERVPAVSHRKAATWGRTLRQDQRERSRPPLEQPCSSPTSGRLNFHRGDSYFLAHVLAAREGADGGKELAGHRLFGSGCASDAPSGPARASL